MIASLTLAYISFDTRGFEFVMPALMLTIALLMVSNIPYPSFKDIDWNTNMRFRTFILLILGFCISFVFKELFFAILFFSYIVYGPVRHLYRLYRARKRFGKQFSPGSE